MIALGLYVGSFLIGFVVLRIARGGRMARVVLSVLAAASVIAGFIEMFVVKGHYPSDTWGGLGQFLIAVALGIVGLGLAASLFTSGSSRLEQK